MLAKHSLRVTLLLLFVSYSGISCAEALFTATYKGKHSGISIKLVKQLEQISTSEFHLRADATSFIGSIKELSRFNVQDGQILPSQYDYVRRVFGRESSQKLYFDWETLRATYRRKDKPKKNADYALIRNALDPSLYQLKLQQELFKGKQRFYFDFAKDGRMKNLEFQLTPTPSKYVLGENEFAAVKVERINQPDKKKTEILLIPALQYQIAEIVHTEEDGSRYKLSLVEFESKSEALAGFYNSISVAKK